MPDDHNNEDPCFRAVRQAVTSVKAYLGKSPEQVDPHKNNDGLTIPSTRLFGILIAIKKTILILNSILIGVCIIALILFQVGSDTLEKIELKNEDQEAKWERMIAMFRLLMPVVIVVIALSAMHNIIAWIGITTLRLRYLHIDFWCQCFFRGFWVALMLKVEPYSAFGILIAEVFVVGITNGIIRQIKNANMEQQASV